MYLKKSKLFLLIITLFSVSPVFSDDTVNASRGKQVYEEYCIVCHRDGLINAPKYQNKQDWASRLAQKNKQQLLVSAMKGMNAMPAMGTCYNCTEADMLAAINYMVPE